jgi:putative aminopeptidase FrvX
MDILKALCSVPTAPFAEAKVVEFVREFVGRHKKIHLTTDQFGNLMIELRGTRGRKGEDAGRWVFAAHMDHPGFVAERMIDRHTVRAAFRGGVRPEYFKGSSVRFFDTVGEVVGRVGSFELGEDRGYPERVTMRVPRAVETGAVGMWDVGEGRVKGKRFYSRVCDNLAGAAGALAMIADLVRRPPRATVAVLLTRGEEEGFIGAIGAARDGKLLKKSDRLVVIECSAQQPYAPQGKGPIVRVGDRTSIFNSALTYFIAQQAGDLAKKEIRFTYQRALMPGGTCEATVYDVYGYTAASICVALGNYHNMYADRKKIGPEFIDLNDWRGMVKLFTQLARNGHKFDPRNSALRERLEMRFDKLRPLLGSTSATKVPRRSRPQLPRGPAMRRPA